jgi:pentapeptide MXKDX repeat protein
MANFLEQPTRRFPMKTLLTAALVLGLAAPAFAQPETPAVGGGMMSDGMSAKKPDTNRGSAMTAKPMARDSMAHTDGMASGGMKKPAKKKTAMAHSAMSGSAMSGGAMAKDAPAHQ